MKRSNSLVCIYSGLQLMNHISFVLVFQGSKAVAILLLPRHPSLGIQPHNDWTRCGFLSRYSAATRQPRPVPRRKNDSGEPYQSQKKEQD